MRKHILILILTVIVFGIIGCGSEGYMEGYIASQPFRVEVDDVKASRGIPITETSAVGAYYPSTYSFGISVTMETEKIILSLYIPDEFTYSPDIMILIPGYSQAIFKYLSKENGWVEINAIEGSYVYIEEIGVYNGDKISGYFELVFDSATHVYGDFSTRVGLYYN